MFDRILYVDMCAIPLYLTIWFNTMYRRMTRGRSNRLYLLITITACLTVFVDLMAGLFTNALPMNNMQVVHVKVLEYLYYITRYGMNVIYLFLIFSVTRTWYRIRGFWRKLLLLLPYLVLLVMLVTNEKTEWVFRVTGSEGYKRGTLIIFVYFLAMIYVAFGITYLMREKGLLDPVAWMALISMYVFNLLGVAIQFFNPALLVECYFTAITLLFLVLFVQRPEKQVDTGTGLPGYWAFCEELEKIRRTAQVVQVVVISVKNAEEMNRFLGEKEFLSFIYVMEEQIRIYLRKERVQYELYYEQPGNFYVILEDVDYNPVQAIPEIKDHVHRASAEVMESGAQPETRIVSALFPSEINEVEDLLRFGHSFVRFLEPGRVYSRCAPIIEKREYQIEAHISEILNHAMDRGNLKIQYLPVWSDKKQTYTAAEAVVSVIDEKYGEIDQELLIAAAQEKGLTQKLGDYLLDHAFAYVGSGGLEESGMIRLSIRLSLSQCMQLELTDQIWSLRERYRVHPEQIEFRIRESAYENINTVLNENLKKLAMQGYGLALDGFGRGYSNMQHILTMPISAVWLDRGMVRSADSPEGRALLKGCIKMLKEVSLTVIARGADDEKSVKMLREYGCKFMQGEYF